MTALANDRNTPRIDGQLFEFPMKAAVLGYVGAIAVLNAGLLQPGATATGLVAVCYIVDDQTVAKTDGSSARSKAGTIVNVDDQGVWVRIGV